MCSDKLSHRVAQQFCYLKLVIRHAGIARPSRKANKTDKGLYLYRRKKYVCATHKNMHNISIGVIKKCARLREFFDRCGEYESV